MSALLLGMSTVTTAAVITAVVLAYGAAWAGVFFLCEDGEGVSRVLGALLGVFLIFLLILAIVKGSEDQDKEDDIRHAWRGGHGPATVCRYENRNEPMLVGKVTVMREVRYTVCDGPS